MFLGAIVILLLPTSVMSAEVLRPVTKCGLDVYPSGVTLRQAGTNYQFCGGVLLSDRWVLTAAHCVFERQDHPTNTHAMGRGQSIYKLHTTPLMSIYISDIYDPKTLEHDFSLLLVVDPFSQSLTFGQLAGPALVNHLITNSAPNAVILAWEVNKYERPRESLKRGMTPFCIRVNFLPYPACTKYYSWNFDEGVMFCVSNGPGGKQPCKGDSGSPIYYSTVVVGVVSYGMDCRTKVPTVFARVDLALEFIRKTVTDHGFAFENKTQKEYILYYMPAGANSTSASLSLLLILILCCLFLT